jgi:hypothetical protein
MAPPKRERAENGAPLSGRRRLLLVAGFLAAAAVRGAWLSAFGDNWDMGTYRQFAEFAPRGGGLYRDVPYHYSPVWAFLVFGLSRVVSPVGIPFEKAVGGLLLLTDAATAYLLFRIARDRLGRPPDRAAGAALLFFSNPVSVFVTGFHLQWDNLAILFLVAAVWLAGSEPRRRVGTALALAASLLVKHMTFFHPLLFARRSGRRRPLLELLLPYGIFFASLLPYWSSRAAVFEGVFRYRSLSEDYGTAMLRKLPGVPEWAPMALFGAAALASVLAFRRMEIGRACLLLSLVILIFVPGVVEYYFVWPIALGSLFGGAGYALFTLLVSAFYLGSPDGLGLPIPHLPGWHGVWWGAVFWLLWEFRKSAGPKSRVGDSP